MSTSSSSTKAATNRTPGWLRPGCRLMQRLRLPGKMALLVSALLPPLALMMVNGWLDHQHHFRLMAREQQGTQSVRQLTTLLMEVQVRRLALARRGEPQADAAASQTAEAIARSVSALDAQLASEPVPLLQPLWQAQRPATVALLQTPSSPADHQAQAEALRRLIFQVGESSNLLLEKEAPTYFLVEAGVNELMPWLDAVVELQALAAAASAPARDPTPLQRARLQWLSEHAVRMSEEFSLRMHALGRAGIEPPTGARAAAAATARLATAAQSLAAGEPAAQRVTSFETQGAEVRHALARLHADVWNLFDAALAQRHAARMRDFVLQGLVVALGLLALGYLGLCAYLGFQRSLREVQGGLSRAEQGDFSQPVIVQGSDELSELGRTLERMVAHMSSMVGEIRSSAVRVDHAGGTVAGDGHILAQHTDGQISCLRRAQNALDDLGQSIGHHDHATHALDELAGNLRVDAEQGNRSMGETLEAMASLEDSVRRVAEINAVIDDIAFQTNLLALNASVEASRAGEAGRGFSVVAVEIRQLANRCTEAASEVRTLIEGTAEQTGVSRSRLEEAGAHLTTIASRVQEVTQRLRALSTVSGEQRGAVSGMNECATQLDELARSNASSATKSARQAQMLAEQAAALRASVASIRLRSGTADEARALIERAMTHIGSVGWQRAAQDFNDPHRGYVDRDMYLFAIDANDRYLVMGQDPSLVGRTVHEVPTLSSRMVEHTLQEARRAAAQGQGWIDYETFDAQTMKAVPRSAYIHTLDDGAFIGCGVARDASGAAAEAQTAAPHTA